MAALTEFNSSTRYAEFAVQDESELDLLPTTTGSGKEQFSGMESVCEGSIAITADFTPYRLTRNGWVGG